MTDDQQRAFEDFLHREGIGDGRTYPALVLFAFEAGLAAAKPRASTAPGPYSLEVRTEAASIALLAAEAHPFHSAMDEAAIDQYLDDLEAEIAERLHAFEHTVIEQTAERLIEAVRMEAAR